MKLSALRRRPLLFGLAACSLVVLPVRAQNQAFNEIAPKQPPSSGVGHIEDQTPVKSVGKDSSAVVAEKLNGVHLIADPKDVKSSGISGKPGLDLGTVTFADSPALAAVLQPYLGKRATLKTLSDLTRDIVGYYREHDRPVVNAYVPQQDVVDGIVQVVVLESHVEKVEAVGAQFFSNDELKHEVSLRPGDPIESSVMRDDIDWINTDPFIQSDLLLAPGDTPGTTDVLLRTRDRFPVRFYVGYEDSGEAQTGYDRYLVGFNYGDLFGLGQQLNYQYSTSGDGDSLRAHSGSWVIPLPWHNTLTFFGSYVDTKGDIPPLFHLSGRSYQISGRYSIPLPTLADGTAIIYRSNFATGFDYKYNDNSLQFGGLPTPATLYDVDQFVMSYTGSERDSYGETTLDDELYVSPGNWGGNNNDERFEINHAGAGSAYVYNTLTAQRTTKLPFDFSVVLRGTLQTSNDNLATSEQIGFGGYDTVRGYDEREINEDGGYLFSTELHTPPIGVGDLFHLPTIKDQLQFLGFWDYGAGYNHEPGPGERSETCLSGVGVGLRYVINTYFSLRYDYGFQLVNTGLDHDHGHRSDIGIVLSY